MLFHSLPCSVNISLQHFFISIHVLVNHYRRCPLIDRQSINRLGSNRAIDSTKCRITINAHRTIFLLMYVSNCLMYLTEEATPIVTVISFPSSEIIYSSMSTAPSFKKTEPIKYIMAKIIVTPAIINNVFSCIHSSLNRLSDKRFDKYLF